MPAFTKLLATAALTLGLGLAPGLASAESVKLTFLLTNDLDKMDGEAGKGGFARVKGVADAERAKGGNVLLIHAGDTISPCLLCGFDQGQHMIGLVNLMKPDIFVPGNHEFDFGKQQFLNRMKEVEVPVLAANLRQPGGGAIENIADTKIVEIGGYKIGFYGLVTEDSVRLSSPGDLVIEPAFEAAIRTAKALRSQGVDFVVAVAHTDRATDFRLMDARVADLILGGHDQDLRVVYDGRTAFAESYEQGIYVTAVDIEMDRKTVEGRERIVWSPNFRIIDSGTATPDPVLAARIKEHEATLSKELDVEIGSTAVALDSRRATVRSQEAAMGNLIADAQRDATGADIAIINGGGIRANRQYEAGQKLTRRDILSELPFGNRTVVTELPGSAIKEALEQGLSLLGEGAGRFPQVSGLIVEVDSKAPAGSRVTKVTVNGQPLEAAKIYKVATNDFMLRGGDGYTALTRGRVLVDAAGGRLMANDVMAYVRKIGTVKTGAEGRIAIR